MKRTKKRPMGMGSRTSGVFDCPFCRCCSSPRNGIPLLTRKLLRRYSYSAPTALDDKNEIPFVEQNERKKEEKSHLLFESCDHGRRDVVVHDALFSFVAKRQQCDVSRVLHPGLHHPINVPHNTLALPSPFIINGRHTASAGGE